MGRLPQVLAGLFSLAVSLLMARITDITNMRCIQRDCVYISYLQVLSHPFEAGSSCQNTNTLYSLVNTMNKRGAAIQKGSLSPDVPWRVLDYPGQCFCQCCTGLAPGSLSALCPWSLLLQQHRRVNGDRLGWCNCEWHDFSKW